MLLLIFGSVFSGDSQSFDLFIQDQDDSELSKAFINSLNQTKLFNLKLIPKNLDAKEYSKEKRSFFTSIRILIIPKGFQDNLLNSIFSNRINITVSTLKELANRFQRFIPEEQKENINRGIESFSKVNLGEEGELSLIFIFDPSDLNKDALRGSILSIANSFYQRALGIEESVSLKSEEIVIRRLSAVDYYLPGILGAFIMTNGVIGVTQVVSEYRRIGFIKRLAVTPLTKFEWILGNLVTQTLLSLVLAGFMILVGLLVFRIVALPDALTLIILMVGAFCFSGLGLIFGGIIKDVEAATALGNAIAFPMMFLSGSFFPIEIMPDIMQYISKFMPLTYLQLALRSSLILKDSSTALSNLYIVVILALIFLIVGTITVRWRER